MHPGRILGAVMGLVILVTFLVVPFGTLFGVSRTLYGSFTYVYTNLSSIQNSGIAQLITAAYLLLIASILILIAGFVGIFPLGTGVLGVVGMAIITAGPYLINPSYCFTGYEAGYYVIWGASIVSLGASFWHGKKAVVQPGYGSVQQTVIVGSAQPVQTPPQSVYQAGLCPNCGTQNPETASFCSKCSAPLQHG